MGFTTFWQRSEACKSKNRARVDRTIATNCPGRVYFKATYWPARLYDAETPCQHLPPDCWVEVVGRDGLTLLVAPVDAS